MKYLSDDNKKVFTSEQECLDYENAILKEKLEKERKAKEKQSRYDEIIELDKKLSEKIKSYEKDYGVLHITLNSANKELFSDLLDNLTKALF